MTRDDNTPDETPRAKATSIPPKAKAWVKALAIVCVFLLGSLPWILIGMGAHVEPTLAVSGAGASVAAILWLLGHRGFGALALPVAGSMGPHAVFEGMRALGMMLILGALLTACGGSAGDSVRGGVRTACDVREAAFRTCERIYDATENVCEQVSDD